MPDTINTDTKTNTKTPTHHHTPDIKNPDAVQKGIIDIWGWVEDNAKIIAVVIGIALLGLVANTTVQWLKGRQERSAQEAYFTIESKYVKAKEGFDRAKFQGLMPQGQEQEKATPATGDLAKDYGTTINELESFARENAGTVAGAQAGILAAQTYLEYKQADKAAELSQLVAEQFGDANLIGNLARMLAGSALATKGDCATAVSTWQKVLDAPAAKFLHGEAALRSGVCFETLNQNDKAIEMYRKVGADAAGSAADMTAKGFLRALEIKKTSATPQTNG